MRKEEKKREKDRQRNRRKKTPLAGAGRVRGGRRVWYGAAACAVALAVALPGALLRFYGERQVGQVQRADNAYFSRQLEAYTGELDLYRKLLLLTGRWKSEKELKAAGTVWLSSELEEYSAAADPDPEQEAWALRRESLTQAVYRTRWALAYGGLEAELIRSSGELAEYQIRDAQFGKYEFTVYLCSFSMDVHISGTPESQNRSCRFTLLLDAETQLILELDQEGGGGPLEEGMGEYWFWLFFSQMNGLGEDQPPEEPDVSYQMPLHPTEEPRVQERWASRQEDRAGEVYAWVYQREDDNVSRFYAGLPQEE